MKLFEPFKYRNFKLENRIIRSATFEGMADARGVPEESYLNLYSHLARQEIGAIITGFAYVHQSGKAMQPGQAGIDSDEKIPVYQKITKLVHENNGQIFLQLAHAGRQTMRTATGGQLWGVSAKKSLYFNEKPDVLATDQVYQLVDDFAEAAFRAQQAGFDGIQLHAAHGYLIHQFILPSINNRQDEFGIHPDYGIGIRFIQRIIERIREKCRTDFPLLVKISGSDDYLRKFRKPYYINLVRFLDTMPVDAIEVSYGTMDYALNIFRGDSIPLMTVLKHNPRYKTDAPFLKWIWRNIIIHLFSLKIRKFQSHYNIHYAQLAKQHTRIPVISVGGFRSGPEMETVLQQQKADLIALSRPFICEPDFAVKLKQDPGYRSACHNCNICAVMCDSKNPTRCYQKK